MTSARFILPALLTLLLAFAASTKAEPPPQISDLEPIDLQYMAIQRSKLEDIARRDLGNSFNGDTDHDLALLQTLLDRRLIRGNQTAELQAMGIVLGDLLARDLDMHWVVYEDKLGRSRALRYRDSDNYLFPVTMISRRREAGNETPVSEIYRKASDIIRPLQTPRPFQ